MSHIPGEPANPMLHEPAPHAEVNEGRILRFKLYEERKVQWDRRGDVGEAQDARLQFGHTADTSSHGPRQLSPDAHASDSRQTDTTPRKTLFGEVPRIEGERVVLDRVVDTDAGALRDLIDNPQVQRYEPTYLFEKQFDDPHEAIAQMYGELYTHKESLILAIRLKGTGELAGLAEFYGYRAELLKISMGYRLRERWWGRGLATEAARLMVSYLYDETTIQIITASTMVENEPSAHVLEKAGFIRTARSVEEDWGFPQPSIVDKWFC